MRFLRFFPCVLILLGMALLFERPAYGYVDPGSGLLALQAAGSALIAAGWYLRRKIYAFFHRGAPRTAPDELQPVKEGEDLPRR